MTDLACATAILLAVCLSVGLILAAVCRLLMSCRSKPTLRQQHTASTNAPVELAAACSGVGHGGDSVKIDVDTEQSELCQLVEKCDNNVAEISHQELNCGVDNTDTNTATDEVSWLSMNAPGGTTIQRALSCDSVLSDTSVTELDDCTLNKVGQLEFSLQYVREYEELVITVIQARDLERDQVTGSLDSYVRVSLTPQHGSRSQTRVSTLVR
jgi:hypothetical protein